MSIGRWPNSADPSVKPKLGRRNAEAPPASPCPACYMPGTLVRTWRGTITWWCDRCGISWQRTVAESTRHGAWLSRHTGRHAISTEAP